MCRIFILSITIKDFFGETSILLFVRLVNYSVFCSGMQSLVGSPPHQKAGELKRRSSSSSLAQDIKISHKRRCDSENIPALDELAYPLGSKSESLASIADKRDKSVSDSTKKV